MVKISGNTWTLDLHLVVRGHDREVIERLADALCTALEKRERVDSATWDLDDILSLDTDDQRTRKTLFDEQEG